MSRHKTPPLTARNWDEIMEVGGGAMPLFEKRRPVARNTDTVNVKEGRDRMRQNFHRSRFG